MRHVMLKNLRIIELLSKFPVLAFPPRCQHKRKYNTNLLRAQIILADTIMAR